MRRILFVMLMLAGIIQFAKAENFFAEGKYWLCEEWNPLTDHYRYFKLIVGRKVDFNGFEARVLVRETVGPGPEKCEYAIGYEDNGCVYVSCIDSDRVYKMLDFNVVKGDVVLKLNGNGEAGYGGITGVNSYCVENVDNIYIDGINRKIIKLLNDNASEDFFYWIEGIGTEMWYDNITDLPYVIGGFDEAEEDEGYWNFERIVECYRDGICIYNHDVLEQYILRNSNLSNLIELSTGEVIDGLLFDLMGRRVAEPMPGQIYVTPLGKKFIRK